MDFPEKGKAQMNQWQQAKVYSFSAGRLAVQGKAADWRPSVFRRVVAAIIDRCVPLPFLAFFFVITGVCLESHSVGTACAAVRSDGAWGKIDCNDL